jgi:uncharacterized protein YbjT (DUF2867 family)
MHGPSVRDAPQPRRVDDPTPAMQEGKCTTAVIGASGRSGAALCRALLADHIPVAPVVRNREKWSALGMAVAPRIADLADPAALRAALGDVGAVVSTAHARHAAAVIAAAPPDARLIFLGSTRKFTRWPDAHGNGVLAGEAAFLASGRNGVMLHPTMIYGATGEDNVRRLAALLRRLPVLPLPGGGKALVQPIHQDDVTRAIRAALARRWGGPHSIVVAGPAPLRYADFVRAVAQAAALPPPRIVRVPLAPLIAAAIFSRLLPLLPTIRPAELRRLTEDKAFDIAPMRALLGFEPVPLEIGLARTFTASGEA